MKTVSVHIVTYNSEDDVVSCMGALLRQSYPIEAIVVVDNASTDGTVRLLLERYKTAIQLIRNTTNTGFAAAHNQAIQATTADYCLVLNPDVELDSHYIRELVGFMEAHPHTGSTTGKLLRAADKRTVDSTGLTISKARRAFDRGAGDDESRWNERSEVFGVSGAAALYARAMIESVSMEGHFFDPDFFAYKEDVDVAWRAQWLGWSAFYIPTALAYHKRGWKQGGRKAQPLFVRRHSYINRYRMLIANDRGLYMLKHLPSLLLFEAGSTIYALFREPGLFKAWGSVRKDWVKLRKKRSWIRSRSTVTSHHVFRFFH